jgi:hypothetical protein
VPFGAEWRTKLDVMPGNEALTVCFCAYPARSDEFGSGCFGNRSQDIDAIPV